ncbi:hypothetical protein CF394_00700 [Tetzosporium hominis]|uniref:Transcriptional regulator n=1 Tax=Tetzosporium hominis TaxID=2020506 RepID=A0A264W794_9BACL|nr:DUF722 domain-containing protein [Tetzosporium hominis]OZS79456.1 hypothetical protein CF394_00700 [Tetzosporium hominis]
MRNNGLKPSTFKHVEAELANYHETQKEIAKRREELMYPTMSEELVGSRGSMVSDPTSAKAARIVMDRRLRELERIEDAITSVYDRLEEKPKQLVHMVYWTRNKKTWEGVAMELEIGRTTLFRWRNEIIKEIADRLGWK